MTDFFTVMAYTILLVSNMIWVTAWWHSHKTVRELEAYLRVERGKTNHWKTAAKELSDHLLATRPGA